MRSSLLLSVQVGDIVRISGLQKAVAFNSKIARVIQEMSVGGTYTIELLDNTQQLLVFPGNIELVRDDGCVLLICF